MEVKELRIVTSDKKFTIFKTPDETLNPVNINVNTNEFWNFIQKHRNKGYGHKFVFQGFGFSLSIIKNMDQLFFTCSGLNDTKKVC